MCIFLFYFILIFLKFIIYLQSIRIKTHFMQLYPSIHFLWREVKKTGLKLRQVFKRKSYDLRVQKQNVKWFILPKRISFCTKYKEFYTINRLLYTQTRILLYVFPPIFFEHKTFAIQKANSNLNGQTVSEKAFTPNRSGKDKLILSFGSKSNNQLSFNLVYKTLPY
jgi:hypothetical protein